MYSLYPSPHPNAHPLYLSLLRSPYHFKLVTRMHAVDQKKPRQPCDEHFLDPLNSRIPELFCCFLVNSGNSGNVSKTTFKHFSCDICVKTASLEPYLKATYIFSLHFIAFPDSAWVHLVLVALRAPVQRCILYMRMVHESSTDLHGLSCV